MMKDVRTKVNFSAKEMFNTVGAESLQESDGAIITVTGFAIGMYVDEETQKEKEVAFIVTPEGMLTTISPTAIQSIEQLEDYFADTDCASVNLVVNMRTSGAGRKFIVLSMV